MSPVPRLPAVLCLLAVIAFHRGVSAHEIRPAYLQIEETSTNQFDVLWKQPSKGALALYLEPKLSNGLLDTPPDQQYFASSFVIRQWQGRRLTRESFADATLSIRGLENTLTDALVSIRFGSGQHIQTLLTADAPQLTIHLTGTGKLAVPAYLVLGIEHILTGFDHLSFVLGLILLVQTRLLVGTITAFTLAHSVTLAAASLGYVRLSVPVIETLVALSIVFVAVELTRSWRGRESVTARHPWLIAFSFGLLHGFAFAGSLSDIGLPEHSIPSALLLFNCGVEIGQLVFVGVTLAFAVLLHQCRWQKIAAYCRWSIAYGIGALASYWTIERINMLVQ